MPFRLLSGLLVRAFVAVGRPAAEASRSLNAEPYVWLSAQRVTRAQILQQREEVGIAANEGSRAANGERTWWFRAACFEL